MPNCWPYVDDIYVSMYFCMVRFLKEIEPVETDEEFEPLKRLPDSREKQPHHKTRSAYHAAEFRRREEYAEAQREWARIDAERLTRVLATPR